MASRVEGGLQMALATPNVRGIVVSVGNLSCNAALNVMELFVARRAALLSVVRGRDGRGFAA
jgi:hypothetical protein